MNDFEIVEIQGRRFRRGPVVLADGRALEVAPRAAAEPSLPPQQQPQGRPTHFLGVRLLNGPSLAPFFDALAVLDVPGLGRDSGLYLPAHQLHLTLGVMWLPTDDDVARARDVLEQLTPAIRAAANHAPLNIRLEGLGTFGGRKRAKVLFARVAAAPALEAVATCLREGLAREGLLADDGRPLRLHATLANASWGRRRRRQRGARTTMDVRAVLEALGTYVFGTFVADAVQLCRIGSATADAYYREDARIALGTPG